MGTNSLTKPRIFSAPYPSAAATDLKPDESRQVSGEREMIVGRGFGLAYFSPYLTLPT